MKKRTYHEKEMASEYLFRTEGPFWHLVTSGKTQEIIFTDDEEFRFCMNQIPLCTIDVDIHVFAFSIMDNHLHCVYSGSRESGDTFINLLRKKLRRYYVKKGRRISIFNCYDCIPIMSLKSLRNEIVYVHRNGYVASSEVTPYSYRWGTGYCYFNTFQDDLLGVPFVSIKYEEKRKVCMSRVMSCPDEWLYAGGIILPSSYCRIDDGHRLFRDAHQYFNLLSRDYEAFCEEAKRMGDEVILTDDELFSAACTCSRKIYSVDYPSLLPESKKIEMARLLHKDYRATAFQIKRILKLDPYMVDILFPKPK